MLYSLQTMALCQFQIFPDQYAYSVQFVFGVMTMLTGFIIGYNSDKTLLRLRKSRQGYQIPYGGLFEYVSMPHYFGEILEWLGFSIACDFSLASTSFVIWTAANLIPRALTQHHWYITKFKDTPYPPDRKAIIPFIL